MSAILSWLLNDVLLFVWDKVAALIYAFIKTKEDQTAIANTDSQDATDLKNAQTEQEKADEANKLAGHI